MKGKIFLLITMVLLINTIMFAGGQQEKAATDNNEPLKMVMPDWIDKERMNLAIDEFMKLNQPVAVEAVYVPTSNWGDYFTKVKTMMIGGGGVDVFRLPIEGVMEFYSNDMLLPMKAYMDQYPEAVGDYKDFHPNLQNVFEIDDEVYGFVWDWNNVVTHINKDMLEKAGLSFPEESWDKDTFLQYAEALTGEYNGQQVFGVYLPTYYFGYTAWLYAFGASVLNDEMTEATINSKEAVACLSFMHDLIYKHEVAPLPQANWSQDLVQVMASERAAMVFAGRWPVPTLMENNINFDVQYIPMFDEQRTVVFGSGGFPASSSTKNPDAAYKLSAFMASAWVQEQTLSDYSIPGRRSVMDKVLLNNPPENSKLFLDSANYAKGVESPIGYTEVQNICDETVNEILFTERPDIQTILNNAAVKINAVLK